MSDHKISDHMCKNVKKCLFCFDLLNILVLVNLSRSVCTGATFVHCTNTLILFGTTASLLNKPTNLKECKKELWELLLVFIMFRMLMLGLCVMLIEYQPGGSNIVSSLHNRFLNVARLVSCSLHAEAWYYMVGNWETVPNDPRYVHVLIDTLFVLSHIMCSLSTAIPLNSGCLALSFPHCLHAP